MRCPGRQAEHEGARPGRYGRVVLGVGVGEDWPGGADGNGDGDTARVGARDPEGVGGGAVGSADLPAAPVGGAVGGADGTAEGRGLTGAGDEGPGGGSSGGAA
ncbi:hypothetical protein AB0F11_33490, partial [Streptomyces sp. NPDC032472]